MKLLDYLLEEKNQSLKGGLYHHTQIKLAYNTNRIEGSKLSNDQTRYIYETNTLFLEDNSQTVNIDDILETVNHFTCFDYLLNIAHESLSEKHIKEFHKLLKNNTSDAKKAWFNVGEYKTMPNVVGGVETTDPKKVDREMKNLLENYHSINDKSINDIIDFHFHFEAIHPFQDGNGRVGRLIIFKECLFNQLMPLIIEDDHKFFYYRGVSEYLKIKDYLVDTLLFAQDNYKADVRYFYPNLF
jgi:Fic family protein